MRNATSPLGPTLGLTPTCCSNCEALGPSLMEPAPQRLSSTQYASLALPVCSQALGLGATGTLGTWAQLRLAPIDRAAASTAALGWNRRAAALRCDRVWGV